MEAEDTWCQKEPAVNTGPPPLPLNEAQERSRSPASKPSPTTPATAEHEESSDDSDENSRSKTPLQRLFTKVETVKAIAASRASSIKWSSILSDSDATSSHKGHSADEGAPIQRVGQKKKVTVVEPADDVDAESTDDVDGALTAAELRPTDEQLEKGKQGQHPIEEKLGKEKPGQRPIEEQYEALLESPKGNTKTPPSSFEKSPMVPLKDCDKMKTMALDDFIDAGSAGHEVPKARTHANRLDDLAKQLAGVFSKYPRGGKSWLSGIQERYFALVQAPSGWAQGALGYWESQAEYNKDSEKRNAKGFIKLLKISQIRTAPDLEEGKAVRLKYKDEDETIDLVIIHRTPEDAEWWCEGLKKFVTLMRTQKDKHTHKKGSH